MNISDNIKAIASKYGKTITQIAAEMNVAQSQLSRTINNERINLKDLQAIAGVIGCQVGDFFSEEANTPTSPIITCPHCGKAIDLVVLKHDPAHTNKPYEFEESQMLMAAEAPPTINEQ
jgi:transcriptional regulator with XRE-family HTH domain